jgi:oligosaccharide repeat unit polymerase
MSESSRSFGLQAVPTVTAEAATWPALVHRSAHDVVRGVLKTRRSIPLYCSPAVIFAFNWLLMLSSLRAHVTYVTYPFMGIPLLLCALSMGSFLLGHLVARVIFHREQIQDQPLTYALDVTRLWNLNLFLCCAALLIIAFNWITIGPPPALGDPTSYLTYGRFKQILFPLLVTIVVNATLDSSRWRMALFTFFGIAGLSLYITRGLLMVALLQAFFVFSLRTNMSRRKLHAIAFGFLVFAIVIVTLIGNARTSHGVFLEYLQIRHNFVAWPMAYLWFTSYASIPFSNLCWIIANANGHGPTFAFLYPLLPSFLMPPYPHAAIHNDLSIIDGASTYLAGYALDFSYLGVYLANLALGFGCGWLVERSLPKQILVSSILLSCLSFIFFSDMFLPLSTILQLIIQSSVQKRCFQWTSTQDVSVSTQ